MKLVRTFENWVKCYSKFDFMGVFLVKKCSQIISPMKMKFVTKMRFYS